MAKDRTGGEASPPLSIDPHPYVEAATDDAGRYGRFNLAIIGATGVGKSSLVNAVFGEARAKTGKGLPVTRGADYYHRPGDPLGIWDLEGFEIGSERTPAESLRANLAAIASRPPIEQISVVWYCVLSSADRLTPPDVAMIRELAAAGLPVILVLTKVAWAKNPLTGQRTAPPDTREFLAWLQNPVDGSGMPIDLPVSAIVLTSSHGKSAKDAGHGLGELVTETLALSPSADQDAFRIAQRLNIPWKRDMARPIIVAAASAAAAAAAVPIPVSGAVVLAPIQLGMMARIATIFELQLTTMMSAGALAQLGVQISGQALARSFLNLIPGVGSAVNATVAGGLTIAMGEAWMRLCIELYSGRLDAAKLESVWSQYVPNLLDVVRGGIQQRRSPEPPTA